MKMVQFFVHNPMLMLIVAGCVLASCSENSHELSSDKKNNGYLILGMLQMQTNQSLN